MPRCKRIHGLLILTAWTIPACASRNGPEEFAHSFPEPSRAVVHSADKPVADHAAGKDGPTSDAPASGGAVPSGPEPGEGSGIRQVAGETAAGAAPSSTGSKSAVFPRTSESASTSEQTETRPASLDGPGVDNRNLAKAETPLRLPSEAEEQPRLTLAELEEMALQNNPTLSQASALVNKARGVYDQVGQYPNPSVGYFGEEMGEAGTAGKQGGFISQSIVTADKLDLNRAVIGRDIETAQWRLQAQRFRVLTDVRLRFYEVLGAQRAVQTARELKEVAAAGVEAAQELLEARQGTRTDLLQARVELSQVRIQLDNARNRYEAAWRRLVNVVGRPDLPPVRLKGALDEAPPEFEWEETYDTLLATSPEFQAALTRIEHARAQVRRQEVQAIPNLTARVGVAHDNGSGRTLASAELGAVLPVFNRNEGNTLAAVAELRRAQQEVERLRLSLRDRLAVAFRDYRNARQQVKKYRQAILPDARENLELTEEGYRAGEFDFLTVLVARRSFFETKLAYVESLAHLQQSAAVIDGLLLTGGLRDLPDVHGPPTGTGLRNEAINTR